MERLLGRRRERSNRGGHERRREVGECMGSVVVSRIWSRDVHTASLHEKMLVVGDVHTASLHEKMLVVV